MSDEQCKWLLETDQIDGHTVKQLEEEIVRQGMEVKYASKVPRYSWETYLDAFPADACVIFCGSLQFSRQLRRESKWVPGVFHTPSNFPCSVYYPYFERYLLVSSGSYTFTKWGELVSNKDDLFGRYGLDNSLFLRPDSGEKPFTGQLIEYDRYEHDLSRLGYDVIPDDTPVVVSEPRNIETEWRFVVADGEVVTGSRYLPFRLRLYGSLDKEATEFAQTAVSDAGWQPDRVWCIDVCQTSSKNFYVIEINSFSCSGLYACNPKPIAEHVSRIALEEWRKSRGPH